MIVFLLLPSVVALGIETVFTCRCTTKSWDDAGCWANGLLPTSEDSVTITACRVSLQNPAYFVKSLTTQLGADLVGSMSTINGNQFNWNGGRISDIKLNFQNANIPSLVGGAEDRALPTSAANPSAERLSVSHLDISQSQLNYCGITARDVTVHGLVVMSNSFLSFTGDVDLSQGQLQLDVFSQLTFSEAATVIGQILGSGSIRMNNLTVIGPTLFGGNSMCKYGGCPVAVIGNVQAKNTLLIYMGAEIISGGELHIYDGIDVEFQNSLRVDGTIHIDFNSQGSVANSIRIVGGLSYGTTEPFLTLERTVESPVYERLITSPLEVQPPLATPPPGSVRQLCWVKGRLSACCSTGLVTKLPGEMALGYSPAGPCLTPTSLSPTLSPTSASPTTTSPTSDSPTLSPTSASPTTESPTTHSPTQKPTRPTRRPTTKRPTKQPTTSRPTKSPTLRPSSRPTTGRPSRKPTTAQPTKTPTKTPTKKPTTNKPTRTCRTNIRCLSCLAAGCAWIQDLPTLGCVDVGAVGASKTITRSSECPELNVCIGAFGASHCGKQLTTCSCLPNCNPSPSNPPSPVTCCQNHQMC